MPAIVDYLRLGRASSAASGSSSRRRGIGTRVRARATRWLSPPEIAAPRFAAQMGNAECLKDRDARPWRAPAAGALGRIHVLLHRQMRKKGGSERRIHMARRH